MTTTKQNPFALIVRTAEQEYNTQVEKRVANLKIVDDESCRIATESIVLIKNFVKALKAKRDLAIEPRKEEIEEIKATFFPALNRMDAMRGSLESELLQYTNKKNREAAEAQRKLDEHNRREQEKQAQALRDNAPAPKVKAVPQAIITKLEQAPPPVIRTTSGSTHIRESIKWRVTNLAKIPDGFTVRIPNKTLLDDKAKEMKDSGLVNLVPGIEFYVDQSVVAR